MYQRNADLDGFPGDDDFRVPLEMLPQDASDQYEYISSKMSILLYIPLLLASQG